MAIEELRGGLEGLADLKSKEARVLADLKNKEAHMIRDIAEGINKLMYIEVEEYTEEAEKPLSEAGDGE